MRRGAVASAEDDELNERSKFCDAAPGREFRDIVVADEVEEVGAWMPSLCRFNRIDGETRPFPLKFGVVDLESRVVRHCGTDHLETEGSRRWPARELVRGDAGGDEDHAVEAQLLHRVAGED